MILGRDISATGLTLINVSPNFQYSKSAKIAKQEKALFLAEEIRKEDEEFSILKSKIQLCFLF